MKRELGIYNDGSYRANIKYVPPGSSGSPTSAYDISPAESGALFWLDTCSTLNFRLPRISSLALGLTYRFALQETASSDDVRITCNTHDSSALIQTAFSSAVDNHTTAIPGSTFFTGAKITAVSSVVWMLEQITASYSHSTDASSIMGGWTTG